MALLPKFDNKEIGKYVLMFEKVAKSMDSPKDMYLFVFSKCVNREGQVCVLCSVNVSVYWLWVRQRKYVSSLWVGTWSVRSEKWEYGKTTGQTHVEFAREKENAFDRWLISMEV